MLTLKYLHANQAWIFVFGSADHPISMGDHAMIFISRTAAVRAAEEQGLAVSVLGKVYRAAPTTPIRSVTVYG